MYFVMLYQPRCSFIHVYKYGIIYFAFYQTGRLRTFEFCKCGIQVQQIESQLTLYPHCKELCWCASISIDIENQGKTKHQYFLFLFIELRNISLMQLLQRQG